MTKLPILNLPVATALPLSEIPTTTTTPIVTTSNIPGIVTTAATATTTVVCSGCGRPYLRLSNQSPFSAQYYRCGNCALSSTKNIMASCTIS
jgi:hypothetical protein